MKLLFDQHISHRITNQLLFIYQEAKQVLFFGLQNKNDSQIWKFAKLNQFAIVTFDKDFLGLSLKFGHPPKVIFLKSYNQTTRFISNILNFEYENINKFLTDLDEAVLTIDYTKK